MTSAEIPTVEELDSEQEALVEEYLALKAAEAEDPKARRKRQRLAGKLDGLYWRRVRSLVDARLTTDQESLSFSNEERLLIDMGLLDLRLVEGADESLRERLLEELDTAGAANHYYFTDWLEDRFRRYLLTRQMAETAAQEQAEEDSELRRLSEARERIYHKLRPKFSGLPGVSEEITESVASGKLEDQIQVMGVSLLDRGERPLFLRRHALRSLRLQVLGKLRARLKDERDIKLVDMLDVVYGKMWAERYKQYEANGGVDAGETDSAVQAGRRKLVARSCAVLLADRPRTTKAATRTELARAQQCDRDFTADPVVLIAPFEGRGIFEWDHDSLVVPLTPVESPEDAVANASANYRMLIDSFQQDGALKGAYEAAFEGSNFQQAFQKDYRDWICRVGHGSREEVAGDHYAFFRQHVGPDCSEVLAPANLRRLGDEARAALRSRLEKQIALGSADPQIHHRLAVVHWQDGNLPSAAAHLSKCVAQDRDNGMALFSLGLVLQRMERTEHAVRAFHACRERAPESIWAVYADEAAAGAA
ncbi:MAG: tetratricopeptide repeat protein [Planctomycetota bacterium]